MRIEWKGLVFDFTAICNGSFQYTQSVNIFFNINFAFVYLLQVTNLCNVWEIFA